MPIEKKNSPVLHAMITDVALQQQHAGSSFSACSARLRAADCVADVTCVSYCRNTAACVQ
eukprot:5508274-Prymnesium_polylepis.2